MIYRLCVMRLYSHATEKQILVEREHPVKRKILYFTCIFINYIALLVAVSIYCCLIKYRVKQKHL